MSDPTPAQSDETLRELIEDAIDNHRFDKDYPTKINFSDIQKIAEYVLPVIAAEKARIYDAVEGLLRPVPHSSGDPLGLLADTRNALRAELRAEIKRLREGK